MNANSVPAILHNIASLLSDEQVQQYLTHVRAGRRRGQAFYLSLEKDHRLALIGSGHDPYFHDSYWAISDAINYLTDPTR